MELVAHGRLREEKGEEMEEKERMERGKSLESRTIRMGKMNWRSGVRVGGVLMTATVAAMVL